VYNLAVICYNRAKCRKERFTVKRKFLSVLLIVAIAVGFCMPVSAATSLKLTDATYPTILKQGDPFIARGIITSDYYIRKVVIGVYNSNGTAEFDYTGLPGEKSYDINDVDYLLSFSKLKNGSYTYKIVASDDNSSDVVLLNKSFTVTSTGQAASTLKITNAKYPDTLDVGEGFSVTGIISSNYNITRIVIGAYKADGTKGFEYIATPNAKRFDVNSVDYSLPFSRLAAGSYTYKITASDTESSNVVLLNKSFTVGTVQSSKLKITNANYPYVLDVGEGFSVTGIISSNYNITKIVIGAYKANGTKGFEYIATPNAKSFDINSVDYSLPFSRLAAGSYTYKITASDTESSNVVLLNKSFTVGSSSVPTGNLTKVNWDVIDISYWNRDSISSWSKIASDIDAIILRLGFAYTASKKMEEDDSFADYYAAAKKYNIPVGVYYFGAATTAREASREADFVISLLKKYNCKLEMPVYYDLETEDQVDLTQAECTEVARTFCDKLKAAGYFVGIYCNKYFARDELYASRLSDYHFWIAEYNSSCTYNGAYGMWQYTETGRVSGIDRVCDKNYCYYDYPSYIKANGLNGFSKPSVANPQFSFKTGANLSLNEASKRIYLRKEPGLTQAQFISKYVSYKDVTVKMTALTSAGTVKTGSTVSAEGNGKSFGPYTVCLIGDINADSKINSADALLILRHAVGLTTLSGNLLISADWNGDGKVNSSDALEVLKFAVSR
jgi:lysozyme